MGKLIKNQLARLIVLSAAAYQVAAAIEGFIWPKVFWDFLTKNFDKAVKPWPILQVINLVTGLIVLAWEWPLASVARTAMHRRIAPRLIALPFPTLAAALLYQATDPAMYYLIGIGLYFWAYYSGETVPVTPWAST